MTAATRGTSTPDAVATTTLRGPTEVAGFGPALVLVATALGVDVPYVAAVTLLRRFSRHRHDYQATGLASANPFQYSLRTRQGNSVCLQLTEKGLQSLTY